MDDMAKVFQFSRLCDVEQSLIVVNSQENFFVRNPLSPGYFQHSPACPHFVGSKVIVP